MLKAKVCDKVLFDNLQLLTLLKTDYKILSKILLKRLARVVPKLLHPS